MNLQRVNFDDDNRIEYEFLLETSGRNPFWYTLIAKFRGRYRHGSAGAPDAAFIAGLTQTALEVWNAAAVVLDLSEVTYEWGDEMDHLLDVGASRGVKSAVVVGPACARAIATLMWGRRRRGWRPRRKISSTLSKKRGATCARPPNKSWDDERS